MSLLLAIHSYPGGNEALKRHWDYFQNASPDEIWVIGTEGGGTWHQDMEIGVNAYIDSEHLPNRLVNTFDRMLDKTEHDWLMIAEYDSVFFHAIHWQAAEHASAANHTGTIEICNYYHNPWLIHREWAKEFVSAGRELIRTGICTYNSAQSSPDVFFGLVARHLGMTVQSNLWTQFSRNSFDIPGDLDLARDAYRNGVDVIHGIKQQHELEYILE